MPITIDNTVKIVTVNNVPSRIWEGYTDSGIPVHCFVIAIVANKPEDAERLERELAKCSFPSKEVEAYPLHMII